MKSKRFWGYTIFWFAIGMLFMMFVSNKFIGSIIVALLLIVGYNMYYCH